MDARRPPPIWPDRVLRLLTRRITSAPAAGQPALIGIDGPSGAGKSTLASQLADRLGEAHILRMDQIYPGWDGLEAGVTILAETVLPDLSRGRTATYPRWDWLHNRSLTSPGSVTPAEYLIIEGAGSCARRCAPHLMLQVWVDAPESVRYERAMARDCSTYQPHWERWAAQEQRHFHAERTASRSDLRLGHRNGS
jgi:uridine kinase